MCVSAHFETSLREVPGCLSAWDASQREYMMAQVQNKVMILIFIINGFADLCHSLLLMFNLIDGG